MSASSGITNSWLVRLVESQGFPTTIFPCWCSLLPYTLIPFYTLSLPCLLCRVWSIWMRRRECKETAIFTTPANDISVISVKAVFTSVASERKYRTPPLFESDIEQFHTVIALQILSCFEWISPNLHIFCSSLGSFLQEILMNVFFLSVFVLCKCYIKTVQGEQVVAVVHFSNLPKLVSPKVVCEIDFWLV